jgi:hypothetical protein
MIFDALLHLVRVLPLLRGRSLHRPARVALCGLALGSASGCVVAPVPPARVGYYHPGVWVPAHWNGWRWVRGHWA